MTVGVIAEFDPFHNGHAYFLRRVRQLTSADFIIAIMSGDFTERGEAAIAGKKLRTKIALMNGADMVIELPVQYSTSSAENFALGGVSLLDRLNVADTLCFGTEDDDLTILQEAAEILSYEDFELSEDIKDGLKSGLNYPAARLNAIRQKACDNSASIAEALIKPNNILGVEYLKALIRTGSSLKPVNIKREGVDHDSTNSYGIYGSAKMIRKTLKLTGSFISASKYVPQDSVDTYLESFDIDYPVFLNDFSALLKYRLLMEDETSLISYSDVNYDLSRRIMNNLNKYISYDQFIELIKTRNITYTRVSRALLHTLLSITKSDMRSYMENGIIGYARVLGMKKEASPLLDEIRKNASVPVITRVAEYKKLLGHPFDKMFEDDLKASEIYNTIIKDKFNTSLESDISSPVIKVRDLIIF